MTSIVRLAAALGGAALLFAAGAAFAQKKYDTGASDTEIELGMAMPYSGPVSSYGIVGKVNEAYFRMVNDKGGINGRKVTLISYDDQYTPPRTTEVVRKLVEQATTLKNMRTGMLLPGIALNTSATDYFPFHTLQLVQFNGKEFEPMGDSIAVK
ncbi:ABC transporter substrate-binding protein [Variovorax paradoxus]|uniref:ABC transporter substrate-binding protein n=1 Tax=Variovorax paradoxus TaxID=34073 RepID=A0A5Q0M1J9_VARPD|nr:ABC transporter substrate-binding protein [Variovorax paradoxus]QFZ83299.1 ABC transporter substrate-binding protein [Variovorax paradoxus]